MMWAPPSSAADGGRRSATAEGRELVVCDWEAVNAGPALWDFAYLTTLSQAAEHRRARGAGQLEAYLHELRRRGVTRWPGLP